jgi:hypothetical protein
MEITSTAAHPFDKCYLDTVGPLPLSTAGNKYILTFQDDLSKYMVATPIGQQDAISIAKVFVSQIVLSTEHQVLSKVTREQILLANCLRTLASCSE